MHFHPVKKLFVSLFLLLSACLAETTHLSYPKVYRNDSTFDDYFKIKVANPLKWISNANDKVKTEFREVQRNLTNLFLRQLPDSTRKRISDIVGKHAPHRPDYAPDQMAGNYYFFKDNLANAVFVQHGLKGKRRLLISLPENLQVSRAKWIFNSYDPSPNGELVAYCYSQCKQNDCFSYLAFRNTSTGKDLKGFITNVTIVGWAKPKVYWNSDSSGIYYMHSIVKTNKTKILYHTVGSNQNKDIFVAELPSNAYMKVSCSEDGKFLIVSDGIWLLTYINNLRDNKLQIGNIFYAKLHSGNCKTEQNTKLVMNKLEISQKFLMVIGSVGSTLYLHMIDWGILKLDLLHPKKENWQLILKYTNSPHLFPCGILDRRFIVVTMDDGISPNRKIVLYPLKNLTAFATVPVQTGSIWSVSIPRTGTKMSFVAQGVVGDAETNVVDVKEYPFFDVKVASKPGENYQASRKLHQFVTNFKFGDETLPITIVKHRHTKSHTPVPTILVVSNSYPWILPIHKILLPFIQYFDGTVAFIQLNHTRGLIEDFFSTTFHLRSTMAAIDYLIEKKYIHPDYLILTTCYGPLSSLLAVIMNTKPKLFKAVLLFDLRKELHTKETTPDSWPKTVYDYASYFNNTGTAKALLKFSPVQNIRPSKGLMSQYPAVLLNDCGSIDSMRYLATLQHMTGSSHQQGNPVLAIFPAPASPPLISRSEAESESIVEILSFLDLTVDKKNVQ